MLPAAILVLDRAAIAIVIAVCFAVPPATAVVLLTVGKAGAFSPRVYFGAV